MHVLSESMIVLDVPRVCGICKRNVKYVDRVEMGAICCISCSHINGFKKTAGTVVHRPGFSPEDPYFISELLRVSEFDLQQETTTCNIRLSQDVISGITALAGRHCVSPQAEVQAALSCWLTLQSEPAAQAPTEEEDLHPQSVPARSWREYLPKAEAPVTRMTAPQRTRPQVEPQQNQKMGSFSISHEMPEDDEESPAEFDGAAPPPEPVQQRAPALQAPPSPFSRYQGSHETKAPGHRASWSGVDPFTGRAVGNDGDDSV